MVRLTDRLNMTIAAVDWDVKITNQTNKQKIVTIMEFTFNFLPAGKL